MSNAAIDNLPPGNTAATPAPLPGALALMPKLGAGLKPLLLLVGIAAAVAAGVSVVLWTHGTNYSLLYANLPSEDEAAIVQALTAAGIPNKLNAEGDGILVPQDRLGEARLKLAAQGLPENDGGFAIMTKDPGLGVSQFVEDARYQHAMESELARTIANLQPVASARVHIAAPRQSAFVRDRRPASASVFVQLKPGRHLEQEQVRAIVNLVGSSIPEMDAKQITVVDQRGHLLSAPGAFDDPAARTEEHLRQTHSIEDDYQQRVESILTPILGTGRVHAQVVAQLDTSVSEQAREQYRPGSQIVRSEQQSEQVSHDAGTQGVPGALTNQPPAPGVAQPPPAPVNTNTPANSGQTALPSTGLTQSVADANGTSPDNVSRQSTRNYEMDRTVDYTQQPAGRIKRLTVAVVVDDMRSLEKGKEVHHPLTQEQIDHMTTLVKDAVGYDESRGDSVSVINASFQADPDEPIEKTPFWETQRFQSIAKLGAGVLVLLVLSLGVLRPLIHGLVGKPKEKGKAKGKDKADENAVLPGATGADAGALTADNVHLSSAAQAALGAPAGPTAEELAAQTEEQARNAAEAYEKAIENARAIARQDPKMVAQVVLSWMNAHD